jgi:exonuclease SbcC
MIKKLKLTNFRQHNDTTIEFVPGINTIVGANNAGKSTIPEAIEFALYGAKALRDTGGSWITDGASSGSSILMLDIGNDIYKVGRDANAAKVYKNGKLEADYKANVTKYISQLTGVNQAGFRLGHYVRQKELAAFSALRPGKRQETIEKMLKIHAVDKVLTSLKEQSDVLDSKLKGLLAAAQDADALGDDLISAQIERAKLTPIIPNETIVDQLRQELGQMRELLATLTAQQSEITNLKKLLESYDNTINQFNAAEIAYNSFEPEAGDLVELSAKLKTLQANEVLKAKMSVIRAELDKELIVYDAVEAPDSTLHDECVAAISAASSNLATVKRLQGMTVCPTCLTEIADVDKLIKSLEDTLEQVKTSSQPIIDAYTTALAESLRLDALHKAYVAELNRRNALAATFVEVEFSEDQKLQVETEINKIRESNAKYIELKHNLDIFRLKKDQLEEAKSRLQGLEGSFSSDILAVTNAKVVELGIELQTASIKLKEEKDLAMSILTDIARLDGRIQELQKAVDSANSLRQTIADTAELVAQIKYRYEVYQKFKKYLTAKIRPMISTVAETLFHKVTKNRYASYQLSNDYEVIINTHQGFVRKLSTISGSENDLANLCLRLAIATLRSNKLVGNLGFIILDEISSSFDEERTKQTLEGLLELKDIIPQIINITHKPVEMKFADKLITVKEVNNRAFIS